MIEKINSTRTTTQILADIDRNAGAPATTLVDVLLKRGPTLQGDQAKKGTIYFLVKGCLTKCTTSDVKGSVT